MKTALVIVTLALLGCTMPTDAQIVPSIRHKPAVVDSTMVFEDRGQRLEVFPTLRATPTSVSGKPAVQHKLSVAGEGTPIGPGHLGVVFNHALQVQGFLTGEIAFKPKGDGPPAGFDAASYPGLAKLTNPNTWIVVASTPGEFLALFNRMKARTDLEWVEAVVIYGTAAQGAPSAQPRR
ncbi:MAG: hypothetical protein JNN03_16545 [Rubrivivax sp.]|nr:hypothetical protein [Rubrivivax sp.]